MPGLPALTSSKIGWSGWFHWKVQNVLHLPKTFVPKTLYKYNLLCYVKCSTSLLSFKAVAMSLYHITFHCISKVLHHLYTCIVVVSVCAASSAVSWVLLELYPSQQRVWVLSVTIMIPEFEMLHHYRSSEPCYKVCSWDDQNKKRGNIKTCLSHSHKLIGGRSCYKSIAAVNGLDATQKLNRLKVWCFLLERNR